MGRPPSNGGPSFRFTPPEIAEMESILQAHKTAMPERQVLVNLSEKFSNSEERKGKIEVQMKQVWNWFQNRRYAIRAKAAKYPGNMDVTQTPRDNAAPLVKGVPQPPPAAASVATVRTFPQPPQQPTVPSAAVRNFPQAPPQPAFSGRVTDNSQMEYEAKSARDGAWYDVSTFLSHRSLDTDDPEVMVRFAGFGAEEDEWVNVRKNVRQRSLPCEASECVAVLPADLILCFQEGKEQALYFDAHVLDAQRRRHDVRGCRCRFLVRYDHDQAEEIVALRKICRRPETDYRLQQLHAVNESFSVNQNKNGVNNNIHTASTLRVYPPAEIQTKQNSAVPPPAAESPQKHQKLDSTVPPDGPQSQLKIEPVADVPQNQQRVQPAAPELESVVPSSSTRDSEEVKSVVPVVVTCSDEVPLEQQKVQVMPGDIPQETQAMGPTVPLTAEIIEAPVKCHEQEPEVPADLHEVQPSVLDQTQSTKTEEHVGPITTDDETKTEEPMVSANDHSMAEETLEAKTEKPLVPTNDANVGEKSVDTETEEPVIPTNDANVVETSVEIETEEHAVPTNEPVVPANMTEAEDEKRHLSETMENNAANATDEKVVNSELAPENVAVAMEEG